MSEHSPNSAVLHTLIDATPSWATAYRAARTPEHPEDILIVRALARLASGRPIRFVLEVRLDATGDAPTLRVKESPPRRLPGFCPDRHILFDGTFCMSRTQIPAPETIERARVWWQVLGGYLDLQVSAMLLGEWEERHAWPHGAGAHALAMAEQMEASLPDGVVSVVREGRSPHGRSPCPCGSRRRTDRCHGTTIALLLEARASARDTDAAYFRAFPGIPCCGTLRDCPLRSSTPPIYKSCGSYQPLEIAE